MKKRILSILTVTAMLLSMCAVSVYAAEEKIETYTVDSVADCDIFTPNANVYGKAKAEVIGVTNPATTAVSAGEIKFSETYGTETKNVTAGQKIKVSLKVAGNTWTTEKNYVYVGLFGYKNGGTTSSDRNNFYIKLNNASGVINGVTSGTWDSETKYNTIKTPNEDWVHYDMVIEVCSDKSLVSLYADGQAVFTNMAVVAAPYTSVLRPNLRVALPKNATGQNIYLSDISMTIYPANYEGTIVEENPLKLTEDFEREGDGAILYKGMSLLVNADEDLVTKEGWTAQYLSSDGYIRIKKGDVVYYYEKATDRIENFNINNMTINPGTKEWTVSVRNIEKDPINPTLFLASYSGENMVKIARSENVTIQPGETGDLKVTLAVGENENVDKIRIFLFNSSGSLVPLKNARGTTKSN